MRALARAGALDRGLDGELLAGFADRGDVFAPRMPIEVDRQQVAGVVGEQRIDAHGVVAFEMGSELVPCGRNERLVRALSALHLRLLAYPWPPLVGATGRPSAATLGVFPAPGEDIRPTLKQALEELDLALAGPAVARHGGVCRFCLVSASLGGTQLVQATARVLAPLLKFVQPSLLREDLSGKVSASGHVAAFCKTHRRYSVRAVR
ncbi:MAG: hypothetical protein WB507_02395 [Solirubrobacterales bacterium]